MKMKLMFVAMLTIGLCSVSLAGSDDYCSKTTKRCGKEVVKPSKGYGGQCDKKDEKKTRCAGCGKYIKQKKSEDK